MGQALGVRFQFHGDHQLGLLAGCDEVGDVQVNRVEEPLAGSCEFSVHPVLAVAMHRFKAQGNRVPGPVGRHLEPLLEIGILVRLQLEPLLGELAGDLHRLPA